MRNMNVYNQWEQTSIKSSSLTLEKVENIYLKRFIGLLNLIYMFIKIEADCVLQQMNFSEYFNRIILSI